MSYVPEDEEAQPLLPTQRTRSNSIASIVARGRSNTISSFKIGYDAVKRHKVEFFSLLVASLILYMGFTVAFLPRTSLSRDFRRFHFSKVTRAETYRIYLESLLRENHAKDHVRNYTEYRHFTGDDHVLQYTLDQLKSYGFSPKIEKYYPWLNTPVDSEVSLWIDDKLAYNASMIEDFLEEDPSSSSPQSVPAFHGYSANGDVTAQFVFCNYGKIEDYEYLLEKGIDLKGKIHIIRYDSMFRGLKVKNAEKYGAAAVILYTDSFDDGEITEANGYKAYPHGPARNPSGIQRGSVEYFTDFPGDPTTPGYASKSPHTKRMSPAGKLPAIPSVPLSGREVAKILEHLNGKGCKIGPGGNIGGFSYYSGPSDPNVTVRVYNEQEYGIQEMSDVIVEIPGILHGNSIIIANHRDSWTVGGAGDPNSGSSILLEIARGFSELRKNGWKPLRTIKLISWDGEEPAMLGSTEYGENHERQLKKQAIAYLNLDTAISGSKFQCEANPLLASVLLSAAKHTPFVGRPSTSLYDHWKETSDLDIGVLGSGTDFAVFQNHLGVPSGNFKFAGNREDDAVYQYHTNYDSYTWMEKFVDPNYELHNTMAIFTGMSALMISEDELIDFRTHAYMSKIRQYYDGWHKMLNSTFPADSKLQTLAGTLSRKLDDLAESESVLFDTHTAQLRKKARKDYPVWLFYKKLIIYFKLTAANQKLKMLDRLFLTERGLKDRDWMKHSIFGPDKYLGYFGDVIPGLHEALLVKDREETLEWLQILCKQFEKVSKLIHL